MPGYYATRAVKPAAGYGLARTWAVGGSSFAGVTRGQKSRRGNWVHEKSRPEAIRPRAACSGHARLLQGQALADDPAGQVQGSRVVVEDELGVRAQQDGVELEGEQVGVLVGGKFALLDGGGREGSQQCG